MRLNRPRATAVATLTSWIPEPARPHQRARQPLIGLMLATLTWAGAAAAQSLPPEVQAALRAAKLPDSALVAVVQEVGNGPQRLAWNEQVAVNPASVFKLVTTYAALDQLGPAWAWRTPIYLGGPIKDGVLEGSLWIRGSGDPKLVLERVWLMLRRLQQMGVKEIRGDILLDRSAWAVPEQSPADFDGEPNRPYNVRPDPLLLNFKTQTLTLTPQPGRGLATIGVEPTLSGVQIDGTVPLSAGPCDDWRVALKPDASEPERLRLTGKLPLACGEKAWQVAYADPRSYNARLLAQLWHELGGKLSGKAGEGNVPAGLQPAWELSSAPLAEVVRDINKFSNNVMAEQLFYSLPAQDPLAGPGPVTQERARDHLRRWLRAKLGDEATQAWVVDNGSGLSRDARVTAAGLNRLLQAAWASPVMPELMSSLPISGLDGTMRRARLPAGRAHLKTGSLRDVMAVGGYLLSASGRRYALVAVIHHPQAGSGRPVLDALTQWAMDDAPAESERVGTGPGDRR
ncbi:D-alanyl-D-alanine carboxypeptidase/D-alanyl-D-alanine endopeptidase [Ideonella sp.]|uniref:D-alanyl-D-alanine carboxypeptidase/D-alanyl-D-alanine endopeptidase n=1 Tax=Ideonella sp. TaxID=1929293 RepID=UPI003BB70C14